MKIGIIIELPINEQEVFLIRKINQLIKNNYEIKDVRDLKKNICAILSDNYNVGCGSNHIWIHRKEENDRFIFIGESSIIKYMQIKKDVKEIIENSEYYSEQ